ncbi:D-amino-acid oxidase [Curvularia clavata]|uniref:D-amino-acid oxidase n=1 Tax=Curvularia clavata TaxID=95742 RepID=A0A9Q8Z1K8_CURCL|nr:D-amino-acid oxidase [Curvularia clavata]
MASKLTEHKRLLWHLYIEKDLTAKQISKYMEEEHQVKHSEGMYQRAFKKWDFKKYCDSNDWVWVDKKQRGRGALGKETRFTFNDRIIDDSKIRKEISRNVSTVQQMTTVTTPKTPSGWAAITPAASTPGYDPSDSHTLHSESPIEQEANVGTLSAADSSNPVHTKLSHVRILAQTMRECGIFIDMCARAHMNITRLVMTIRYFDVAWGIVLAQPQPPFVDSSEYPSALRILQMTFFNDHLQLDQFLRTTERTTDDVLRTALFLTCKGNQHQAANVLLSHGAEPNSKDSNGDPCLIVASRNNLDKIVKLLLDFGADVEAKDLAGKTSWSHVCGLQSHDLVALVLQERNAEKNVNWKAGHNSLHMASALGHVDQVRVMLSRGMDPSFANLYQYQPLASRLFADV